MGNKPNAPAALSEEDIQVLFEKDLLGSSTAPEYLEFNERQTKTRSRNDPRNVKAIAPKMFSVPNNQKCPVKAYKAYAEKRPVEMETNDAPFPLTVLNVKSGNNDVPPTDIMQLSGHKNCSKYHSVL